MDNQLPDFDILLDLAQNEPEQLETLRKRLSDDLISSAPNSIQQRLRGLQFQVDMERRRSPNSMASCIKISGMMHDSFTKLRTMLNSVQGKEGTVQVDFIEPEETMASIIPFKR